MTSAYQVSQYPANKPVVWALEVWRRLSGTQNLREKKSGEERRGLRVCSKMLPASCMCTERPGARVLYLGSLGQHHRAQDLPSTVVGVRDERQCSGYFTITSVTAHTPSVSRLSLSSSLRFFHTPDCGPTFQCTTLNIVTSYDEP